MICRNLKFYEKALSSFGFYRIHRSHLINLEYLKRYLKGKGGTVVLENGKEFNGINIFFSNLLNDKLYFAHNYGDEL